MSVDFLNEFLDYAITVLEVEEIYGQVVAACRIASMYCDMSVMGNDLWAMHQ